MKTIQFNTDKAANAIACPTIKPQDSVFNLSYYTLCRLQESIEYNPTPTTMGMYCSQHGSQTLTLDDLGNFVSIKPSA